MSLYQRRSFLGGSEFDGAPTAGTVRREKVCIMEIWCECFGKERQNLKRTDSYEVESILMKIGGWEPIQGLKSGKPASPSTERRRRSCGVRNKRTDLGTFRCILAGFWNGEREQAKSL